MRTESADNTILRQANGDSWWLDNAHRVSKLGLKNTPLLITNNLSRPYTTRPGSGGISLGRGMTKLDQL